MPVGQTAGGDEGFDRHTPVGQKAGYSGQQMGRYSFLKHFIGTLVEHATVTLKLILKFFMIVHESIYVLTPLYIMGKKESV